MKLKINAHSSEYQTKNNNSREMPTFLLGKYTRFFDFDERRAGDSYKKIYPTRNISTIDFNGTPDNREYPASIKNVSMVGSLMSDDIQPDIEPKQRQIYINKIFGQKKEVEVPTLHVESHKYCVPAAYQTFMNEKNGFSKPFQFSKLVDQLSNTRSINRHNPMPNSAKEVTNPKSWHQRTAPRQITRHSFATTKNRKYQTIQDTHHLDKQLRKMSCQNTRDKYQKVFNHYKQQEDRKGESYVIFNNAMSHLVDSENILQILEKNRSREQSRR